MRKPRRCAFCAKPCVWLYCSVHCSTYDRELMCRISDVLGFIEHTVRSHALLLATADSRTCGWRCAMRSIRVKGGYLTPGDACEFRASFRQRGWRPGFVRTIEAHRVLVEALSGGTVEILPGKRGKLRVPDGPRSVEIHTAHEAQRSGAAPAIDRGTLRASTTLSSLRPVIVRRPRHRSRAYLDHVRALPCLACEAPAPSEAHHAGERGVGQKADDHTCVPLCRPCHRAVTDTGCLPGCSRTDTQVLILQAQVELLIAWIAQPQAPAVAERPAALPQAPAPLFLFAPPPPLPMTEAEHLFVQALCELHAARPLLREVAHA